MALLDSLKGKNVLMGLAIGIGAAVLAPVVVPIIASAAKPLAKEAIKGDNGLKERPGGYCRGKRGCGGRGGRGKGRSR